MTQDYNGWTNRETWATALHINNDQGLYETMKEYTEHALTECDSEPVMCLEETLENWIIEDLLTLENLAGNEGLFSMLTDIGSLYRVNWREIAESFLSDMKQEVNA
jgi:hypothetical protein